MKFCILYIKHFFKEFYLLASQLLLLELKMQDKNSFSYPENSSSVHTSPKTFENATIIGHLGFVFEENSVREIT